MTLPLTTLASALCLTLAAAPPALSVQQGPTVIILGGHLFDGLGDRTVPNPGIVIRAGKFLQLGGGPSASGPDVTIIDLDDDQYVLPGLFDLHAHYAIDLFGQGRIDERWAYPVIFLANGVTTTFPAGEMNPVEMRELRMRIDRGEAVGPRILNSGPYFGSWRPGWDPEMTTVQIYEEVDYWAAQGARGFKAKGITPEHLRALIDRAHQHGLTVTGHLGSGFRNSVNPRDAILMGIDRVEHFLGGDAIRSDRPAYSSLVEFEPGMPEFQSIADLYIRHNVYFDATLSAYGYYGRRDPEVYTYYTDEKAYLTPYVREILEAREPRTVSEQFETIYWVKRKTVKAFFDAGGGHLITLGTDHPSWGEFFSGFSVHRELLSFALTGIPAADVIKFATINAARAMGLGDRLGSIEAGKLADLVVVRGNPLDDIRNTRNVDLVIKAGKVYDARELLRSAEGAIGPRGADQRDEWMPRKRDGN